MKFRGTPGNAVWLLTASLLVCFGTWRWAQHVLIPANTATAHKHSVPIGNNSDLYPRWLGARELLLHRRDPYSAEVTRAIQAGFYGRPLDPSRPADPTDQAAFAYPVYIVFLLAPTVALPFASVVAVCRWLFLLGLAASVPLWMHAIGFRMKALYVVSAMLLLLSCYPSMLEFYMQNLSALVAVLLALASAAAVQDWLLVSGFLLALSTIKPQLAAFFILWFLLWASAQWKERWRLLVSFVVTLLALVVGGEILLPGWIKEFFSAVHTYRQYTTDYPSALRMFFPPWLAVVLGLALLAGVLALGWQRRKSPAGSASFGWMLAWSAVATLMVVSVTVYNQVVLVPALLALLAQHELIWKAGRLPRALTKAVMACLIWQWMTAAILGWASFLVNPGRLLLARNVPLYLLLAVPATTLVALAGATPVVRARENGPPS